MKWTGIAAAVLLIISCFLTWVVIVSKNIIVTGVNAAGTNFGKPGYFNLLMTLFFVAFTLYSQDMGKATQPGGNGHESCLGRSQLLYYFCLQGRRVS